MSLPLDYHLNSISRALFKGTIGCCLQPIYIRWISMRLFLNFKDTSEVGVGVIIQNDKSELIVMLSIREKMIICQCNQRNWGSNSNPIIQAISFPKNVNIQNVIIKGDSLTTIKALTENEPDFSIVGDVLDEVRNAFRALCNCMVYTKCR